MCVYFKDWGKRWGPQNSSALIPSCHTAQYHSFLVTCFCTDVERQTPLVPCGAGSEGDPQLFSGLALPLLAHSSALSRLGITSRAQGDFFCCFLFYFWDTKQNRSKAVMRVLWFRVVGVLTGLWISRCEAVPHHWGERKSCLLVFLCFVCDFSTSHASGLARSFFFQWHRLNQPPFERPPLEWGWALSPGPAPRALSPQLASCFVRKGQPLLWQLGKAQDG